MMYRTILTQSFLIGILFFLGPFSMAQTKVSLQQKQHFSTHLLGLNGRSTEGPSWSNPHFLSLIKSMNPAFVRYPAGTQANYWDWHTGTFIEGCGKKKKTIFTPAQCIHGLPENTQLIYVINMVRPTPSTGFSLTMSLQEKKSEAVLNAKINDIIDALRHFEQEGHLPEIIEFGNEFYFDNEHADIYGQKPDLYLEHCKKIGHALRALFPDLKFIVCTTKPGSKKREAWNRTIYQHLQQDTALNALIDGIVQHHYINEKYGSNAPVTHNNAMEAIAEGFLYPQRQYALQRNTLPNKKLWITEFGVTKENASATWIAGLRAAAMTMGFWDWDNKVENLLWHHITSSPDVLTASKQALGPVGIAYSLLQKATKGNDSFQKMIFDNNPTIFKEIKALHGYKISHNNNEGIVLLNSSNQELEIGNLASLFTAPVLLKGVQYWSNCPFERNTTPQKNEVEISTESIHSLILRPFSMTYLAKDLSNTVNRPIATNYFSCENKQLHFFCPFLQEVTVFNRLGQIVYRTKKPQSVVDLERLPIGIYFITLTLDKECKSFKFCLRE